MGPKRPQVFPKLKSSSVDRLKWGRKLDKVGHGKRGLLSGLTLEHGARLYPIWPDA
jgi:hypothetical protein